MYTVGHVYMYSINIIFKNGWNVHVYIFDLELLLSALIGVREARVMQVCQLVLQNIFKKIIAEKIYYGKEFLYILLPIHMYIYIWTMSVKNSRFLRAFGELHVKFKCQIKISISWIQNLLHTVIICHIVNFSYTIQ